MFKGTSLVLFFALTVLGQALTPNTYFTHADQERLRMVFQAARPYGDDLESVHYSVLGLSVLQGILEEPRKACDAINKNVDVNSVDSLFFAASVAENIKKVNKHDCKLSPGNAAKETLDNAITETATTETLYHAVTAQHVLGYKVDNQKISAALTEALKSDETPLSYGYAFYAASHMSGDLKKFHDLIEDIIAQADEVEEKYLQFEGGLYTTAVVIDSAYKLAAAAKIPPTLSEDKVIKFANYFLSRKHVQSLRNAAVITSVAKTLTDNQYHIPVAVTLASQVSVSDQYPVVQVRVSNLLGKSLGKVSVTADTARHLGDDAVVLSKKPFLASTNDNSLYELDFLKANPPRGFYKIIVSVVPQQPDKRLIGTSGAEVDVKVTTELTIDKVEIGVSDMEQSAGSRTSKLQYPNKVAQALEADNHQRISLKFQLVDKSSGEVMTAHQTFVQLTNHKTKQEIIFVAEPDSSDLYKYDLDVGSKAKDFNHMSGKYAISLIIGDAVIQNPFSWTLADVNLKFPEGSAPSKKDTSRYAKKKEIKHEFRKPEKRPPTAVSNVFTGLVLIPLLLLIIMWIRLGVNISNMPISLSALGFHLGLCAIFGLYYCYWTNLDMFQTLRYLGIIGIPTFLFGNRLLSNIAAKRK